MTELLMFFGTVYMVMAFIKFMLCAPHIGVAVCTLSRLHTGERHRISLIFALTVPLITLAVAIVNWIPALYKERLRFFVMYNRSSVIRNVVRAHREPN